MPKKRRQYSARFKFQVALDALQESQTITEIAQKYEVHPSQVKQWKRQLREEGMQVFETKRKETQRQQDRKETELYEQIGRLQMELAWLKKKVGEFS
jgi:putative transposase